MRTTLLVFALFSLSFSATLFSPAQYFRTSGPPNVYETTFVALDTTVACTLVVLNGMETGSNRLSAASVKLNGVEVISESAFN